MLTAWATDVVAVNHGAGRVLCSNFNLVGNRTFSGSARIRINDRDTDLIMQYNAPGQRFEFPRGSLVPDDWLLASLPLSVGLNTLEFHIETEGSPSERATASAALWLWTVSDRIVVVDIDGTITKSDLRGLLFSDYNHDGVADAISYIASKGYSILYLTARPISMATGSRTFLASISQGSASKMPDGALITQPHGTMKALTAKHDEFKIFVLAQIQSLFEGDSMKDLETWICDPQTKTGTVFAAGFGNTHTDIRAYDRAGIPRTHIFVPDKSSRIKNLQPRCFMAEMMGTGEEFQSYTGLRPHLDYFFPGAERHPYPAAPAQPCEVEQPPLRRERSSSVDTLPVDMDLALGLTELGPIKREISALLL